MDSLFSVRPSRTRVRRFSPRVEALESRLNLAGALTAALVGQTLTITGDELANEVRIVGNGAGNLSVSGVNGTLLNDVLDAAEDFTGVANLVINLLRPLDRAGNLIAQNFRVAFAKSMNGHAHDSYTDAEPGREVRMRQRFLVGQKLLELFK